jgi:hypothetical protein
MFDRSHPGEPLAVRYPAEGTYQLTYPYVLTTANRLTQAVAQKFGAVLRSPYGTAYMRYEGFRAASGKAAAWPSSYGLARSTPHLLPQPGPAQAGQALLAWRRVNLGTRVLALNDVSSVMATPIGPGGPTLEQVLSQTAVRSLARFPANTQIGVWAFASRLHGSLPYKQIMPIGPIQSPFGLVTRRMQIQRFAAAGTTVPTGAALYGTILAAYKTLAASYQPGYVNAVIVLTAGVENAPGDISRRPAGAPTQPVLRPAPADPDHRDHAGPGRQLPRAAAGRRRNAREGIPGHPARPGRQHLLPRVRAAHLRAQLPGRNTPAQRHAIA